MVPKCDYVTQDECEERHGSNKSSTRLAITLIIAFIATVAVCISVTAAAAIRSEKNEVRINNLEGVLQEMKSDQRQSFSEVKQELRDIRSAVTNGGS